MNSDTVETTFSLIKEKIIKTDIVLNIVCEKNALISELQSKLDLVGAKFIDKCQQISLLNEELTSKEQQIYTLTEKLVRLQEQYDQILFDYNFIQMQFNEKINANYLTIQNLESQAIKLGAKIQLLTEENELLKVKSSNTKYDELNCSYNEALYDVKDFKRRYKVCLKRLQTCRENRSKLEISFSNYKKEDIRTCSKCSEEYNKSSSFQSSLDYEKEKYKTLSSQFKDLQQTLDNIDSIKKIDGSSQTIEVYKSRDEIEDEILGSEDVILKRVAVKQKIDRMKELKMEIANLKEELAEVTKEKRILRADCDYLSKVDGETYQKYQKLLLEKQALELENKLMSTLIPAESNSPPKKYTPTLKNLDKIIDDEESNEIIPTETEKSKDIAKISTNIESDDSFKYVSTNNGEIDDLGLNLSSDSEVSDSESESVSCESILGEMVKFHIILSPIPKTPESVKITNILITPASPIIQNDLSISNDSSGSQQNEEYKKLTKDESTQTNDFAIEEENSENVSNLSQVSFGCQTVDIFKEDKENQTSSIALKNIFVQTDYKLITNSETQTELFQRQRKRWQKDNSSLKKALRIIKQANYDVLIRNVKIKQLRRNESCVKENLKSALKVFRKYSITMSFEKGDLINLENKNEINIQMLNSFLKRFFGKYRDLKRAMHIANRRKLTAVIVNGFICDNNILEDNKIRDISNCKFEENSKLKPILDNDENLKGFGEEYQISNMNKIVEDSNILFKRDRRKTTIQHSYELRNKFVLENNDDEIWKRKLSDDEKVEENVSSAIKKIKTTNFSNKDNNSVDFDSGYTDGSSETSDSILKEIDCPRLLRSSKNKRNNSTDSKPLNNADNKKRKISVKDLFGSDDSSEETSVDVNISLPQKSPIKKKKVTVLQKMRKILKTYNPVVQSSIKFNECKDVVENKPLEPKFVYKKQRQTQKCDENQLIVEYNCVDSQKINVVKNVNKEHLMQRFISDIPIIKPIPKVSQKTVFKKPLSRRKSSIECENENLLINIDDEDDNNVNNSKLEETNGNEDGEISEEDTGAAQNILSEDESRKLLNKLIQYNCEETIVKEVVEKIAKLTTPKIASLVIYFLYKYRLKSAEPSHTPLAPALSPMYKTLIGFTSIISSTEEKDKHNTIFTELLDQLESKLLLQSANSRINSSSKVPAILSLEQVYRLYVSVCMMRAEVLRLRRFLCDMAYYQRDGWYALVYAVFTIWPSLLPKHLDDDNQTTLKHNDAILMKVLMFFIYKKRNSVEYMYYRPFLTTFAFGYYKYKVDDIHIKLIFDELVEKFTSLDSNIVAYSLIILLQRITTEDFFSLLRSESFNNVFNASDEEKLIAKSKLLWLLDRIIPEMQKRGDKKTICSLKSILEKLQTKVENEKVINFIRTCIEKLTK